jgi:hypothetical protein
MIFYPETNIIFAKEKTMLFPQLSPQYYDEKHQDILARMETFYAQSITING